MLRNYLTIALRALKRRPGPALISVTGLAVGLAACLLIGVWVQNELSYDTFHEDADRTYRLILDAKIQQRTINGPISSAPLAPTIQRDFPSVEAATRFDRDDNEIIRVGDRSFTEQVELEADSSFFRIFDFESLHGALEDALVPTNAVVLTKSTAERYFGRTNVVGETLLKDNDTHTVTAVLADVPHNSHLQFDLISVEDFSQQQMANWLSNNYLTYFKLVEGTPPEDFQANLNDFVAKKAAPIVQQALGISFDEMIDQGARYRYDVQPMLDIHLYSDYDFEMSPGGSITYVYTFSAIALFILLIACINFMNLATARASERATEVGVRKSLGAQSRQLASQFLSEAVLTTAFATLLALGLAAIALPFFNDLAGTVLGFGDVLSWEIVGGGVLLVLLVGLLSGSYPAFALSQFEASTVLKSNDRHSTGGHGKRLRQGLVVFQFAISIVLIVSTLVAERQFDFIQQKELGLDKERVVVVNRPWVLENQQASFINRLQAEPTIVQAGAGSNLFQGSSNSLFVPDDAPGSESVSLDYMGAAPGFVPSLGLKIVAGRNFDPGRPADSSAILINESAMKMLGWEDDPTSHVLRNPRENAPDTRLNVIGVVGDFHYMPLEDQIEPLVIRLDDTPSRIYARLEAGQTNAGLERIRQMWQEAVPGEPFQYTFLDQTYAEVHRSTERTGRLFSIFAGLAVVIACLGLFGLATYVAQRRTKEIGIRKALGATSPQIVGLLSKEFLILVGIAFVLALPLAYVGMQQWLEDFAYRIDVGVGVFAIAGALAITVAFLTVSSQAFRAARTDPARALRDE